MEIVIQIVVEIAIAISAICVGVAIDLKIRKKRRHQMLIMRQDAVEGLEKYYKDELGNPMLLGNWSNDWIWCDERMPTAEEAKFQMNILVAELDHGEDPADPNAHWCIDVDYATYCGNGEGYAGSDWFTDNDWDEGQPWAVVAWRTIPKLPDIDQVKCRRDIKWLNVKQDRDSHAPHC